MRIIMVCWDAINESCIRNQLVRMGHEVDDFHIASWRNQSATSQYELMRMVHQLAVDILLSVNFIPFLSEIAQVIHIPYFSWVFDCPHNTLFLKSAYRSHWNQIGVFDREYAAWLREIGIQGVYWLPLAAEVNLFDECIRQGYQHGQMSSAGSDVISMVGSMKPELLTDEAKDIIGCEIGAEYRIPREYAERCREELRQSATERRHYLEELGKNYSVKIYTDSRSNLPEHCMIAPAVSYLSQMPLVFHHSKINLHFNLKTFRSGIGLRAWDILACGGFLMSSFSQELAEMFVQGEELEMFSSEEELLDKCDYYLHHEEIRVQVARRGAEKARKHHTYEHRLKVMLAQKGECLD